MSTYLVMASDNALENTDWLIEIDRRQAKQRFHEPTWHQSRRVECYAM